MRANLSRLLSSLIAAGYLAIAMTSFGGEVFLKIAIFLLLPMSGIWFPAQMGAYVGNLSRHPITSTSPAFMVSSACWFLLLVPVIGYFIIELI